MPTKTKDTFQDLIPKGYSAAPASNPPAQAPAYAAQTLENQSAGPETAHYATQPSGTTEDPSTAAPSDLFSAENVGGFADSLQPFADKAPEVKPEETMQGQLDTILNKDNQLFDWARGQASQYANSRGLQNSDIAAQASSQAVLDVAMPIAEHDANVYSQRAADEARFWQAGGLQAMEGTIQSSLIAQDHLNQLVQQSQQGDINSRLQLEQFGYNFELSQEENLHRLQQLALQGDIDAANALQQFGFDTELMKQDYGFRVNLTNLELKNALALSAKDNTQWLERIAAGHANTLTEIAAQGEIQSTRDSEIFTRELQANYLGATERRTSQFSEEVARIYQTEGLTPAQQNNAVNVARNNYENDIAMLSAYYESNPAWNPNWNVSGYEGVNTPTNQPPPPTIPPATGGTGGTGVLPPDPRSVSLEDWLEAGGSRSEWFNAREDFRG